MPWLWLGALVLAAGAVLAARTFKLPFGEQAQSAQPTLVASAPPAVGTPRRALATAAPTVRSTPVPAAAAATVARPRATAAPTRGRAASATRAVAATVAAPTAVAVAHSVTAAPTAASVAAPSTPSATATPSAPTASETGALPAPTAAAGAGPVNGGGAGTNGGAAMGGSAAAGAGPVTGAEAATGAVMLTFDAGADRGYAEDILDLLADEHVVASFGVTGQWAKANPELVRRMAADGHLVFNHTLDHRSFTGVSDERGGLPPARRRAELEDADAILAPLIGHTTQPWYRLPYGDDDARVAADVQPAGYTRKIGWTVDSLGWRGASSTDIVARCLKLAAPGAVFAFHVGRASQDAIALPQVIHGLRDKGFAFRRVDTG